VVRAQAQERLAAAQQVRAAQAVRAKRMFVQWVRRG
jgi:hypothetical protein